VSEKSRLTDAACSPECNELLPLVEELLQLSELVPPADEREALHFGADGPVSHLISSGLGKCTAQKIRTPMISSKSTTVARSRSFRALLMRKMDDT
jgi:hypothetical protein